MIRTLYSVLPVPDSVLMIRLTSNGSNPLIGTAGIRNAKTVNSLAPHQAPGRYKIGIHLAVIQASRIAKLLR